MFLMLNFDVTYVMDCDFLSKLKFEVYLEQVIDEKRNHKVLFLWRSDVWFSSTALMYN